MKKKVMICMAALALLGGVTACTEGLEEDVAPDLTEVKSDTGYAEGHEDGYDD